MDYLLIAYYYSVPFLMAIGAAFGLVLIAAVTAQRPLFMALLYLAVFFIFPGTRFGAVTGLATTIYGRGSGQLYFPFVVWALFLGTFWVWFTNALSRQPNVPGASVQKWFGLWFLLLLIHICVGLVVGVELVDIIDSNGFVNLAWMGLLIAMVVGSCRDASSMRLLLRFLVVLAFFKSGFGLVRWAAFGGDPSNIYANFEKLDVKLTFFDIGDSLSCFLGAAVCASQLYLTRDQTSGGSWRSFQWITLLLSIACIFLSYRRTAWIGLFLAGILMFMMLKPRGRFIGLMVVMPVLTAALLYIALKRFDEQANRLGLLAIVYDLVGKRHGAEGARPLELRMAFRAFMESPLFGLGAWGSYGASRLITWQDPLHPGNFLHSGVLHILLKAGLVGFALFSGVVVSFVRQVRALRDRNSDEAALIFAGCCGLLFMVPDFVIGTPVPQFRTTQLIAFCIALPFVVARVRALRTAIA